MCYERTVLNNFCQCVNEWIEPCGFYQRHALERHRTDICSNIIPTLEIRDRFCPSCITGPLEPGLSLSPNYRNVTRRRVIKYAIKEKVALKDNERKKNVAKESRFRKLLKKLDKCSGYGSGDD